MTWVKLDDRMPEHPKVARLRDKAFRAHVEALCYCSGSLTDGFIPEAIAKQRGWARSAAELAEARLWEAADGGWTIHDYLDHQRSKQAAVELSEKRAEAGAKGGSAKANPPAEPQANAKQIASPVLKQIRSEEIRSEIPIPTESVGKITRARGMVQVLTEQDRDKLRIKFGQIATVEEINEQIELALAHKAVSKTTRQDLYVNNWLRRSFEGRNERAGGGRGSVAPGGNYPGARGFGAMGYGGGRPLAAAGSEYANDFRIE